MTVSCRTCPSFVDAASAAQMFKHPPGADVCARYGHMLSKGNDVKMAEKLAEAFAGDCDAHGQPRPNNQSVMPNAQVSVGMPSLFNGKTVPAHEKPASCHNCQYFIGADVVRRELGWNQALCAATGRLIYQQRWVSEASSCLVGRKGPNLDSTNVVNLLPEYEVTTVTVNGKLTKPKKFDITAEIARHSVDPREYVTDKPVSPAEHAEGIRAWRKVNDPEGLHEPVFMPIFDGVRVCGFDPRSTYGSHRPDLYVDHHGYLYDFAVELFENDETPLMIGGAGTGKTEMACYLAYLMDLPFTRISISKGTEDYHLAGDKELDVDPATGQNVTRWKMGRFAEKWPLPNVILVDEPNLKEEIYNFLRPAMDNARQLVLDGAQGIVVTRGDKTFLVLAQNPADDPIYVGTEPMNAADLDRVSPFFFGLPTEDVERQIITKHCLDAGYDIPAVTLDKIMQAAKDIRKLIADGALQISWGLRPQIKVAKKTKYYSFEKAYKRAVIDGLDQSSVDPVLAVVRSVA